VKYRALFVCTHPVQYAGPMFRRMEHDDRLQILVAYCSLEGAKTYLDREFGVSFAWDVPLLDDYRWVCVPNRSWWPGLGHAWGLFNPGLWDLVRSNMPDAVILLTGYKYLSFWIALAAAKVQTIPVIFGTDASELGARDGRRWKSSVKRWLWPALFGLADVITVPSTRGVRLIESLGLLRKRIVLTPYVVDNDWWTQRAAIVDRAAVRRAWHVPDDAPVVLFCGKLQKWKRPQDLLRAFARANVRGSHLIFAGEGPLRRDLEKETISLELNRQVHFLGFANQTQLPDIYRASDLMVLPSEYEPFGLVVNEAMLCGCPVVLSDRVGAGDDLVMPGQNGFVFPRGDVDALAAILREVLPDSERLKTLGEAAQKRMCAWSPSQGIDSIAEAVECAVRFRLKRRKRS
jgi:glycosyltransferase involved in cell wall biosynthesis